MAAFLELLAGIVIAVIGLMLALAGGMSDSPNATSRNYSIWGTVVFAVGVVLGIVGLVQLIAKLIHFIGGLF